MGLRLGNNSINSAFPYEARLSLQVVKINPLSVLQDLDFLDRMLSICIDLSLLPGSET